MNKLLNASLIVLLVGIGRSYALDFDGLSKAVVFLEHDNVETFSNGKGVFEVWLKQPNTNIFVPKISSVCGTGFLVSHSNHFFLVTAKHVASDIGFTESDKIIIGMQNGKSAPVPLALFRGGNTNGWINHERADVSILPVEPPPQLQLLLQGHFLDSSFLETGTNRPSRDVMLTIVGFPLGMGWGQDSEGDFAPLSRKTRVASGFINGGTLFLLEDPSVQGYSGAPIFDLMEPVNEMSGRAVFRSGPMACCGVISSTYSDNTGGKMGAVVPTKFILELIGNYENSTSK